MKRNGISEIEYRVVPYVHPTPNPPKSPEDPHPSGCAYSWSFVRVGTVSGRVNGIVVVRPHAMTEYRSAIPILPDYPIPECLIYPHPGVV